MYFIEMKHFCSLKNLIKRMKRQSIDWENTFVNYIIHYGLRSRICDELQELSDNRANNSLKKWAKDKDRHFIKSGADAKHKKMVNIINH